MRKGSQKQRPTAVLGILTYADGKEWVWKTCPVLYSCSMGYSFQLKSNKDHDKMCGRLCGGSEVCDSAEIGKVVADACLNQVFSQHGQNVADGGGLQQLCYSQSCSIL